MRFLFLGTGTSSGIPAIACSCAVCTSADPRDNRLRSGAAITFTDPAGHERVVLIDATPDLRQQALRAGLMRCDAILFTHNHVDHTFGVDEVRRFNAVQKSPIDIYAEDHTMDHLRRVYKHIFDKDANVNDSFVATLIARRVTPGTPIDLFGVRFTPIRLLHGRLPIVGYRIDPPPRGRGQGVGEPMTESPHASTAPPATASPFPLAYCTDVSGIPPESYPLLRGLNTLVLDCLRHRAHPTHLTLQQAATIAEQVGARQTYFTHIAHDLPHEETNRALPDGLALAHDGLVLGIVYPHSPSGA
ncbi:MAG: MBL fold metallo-hydrolase [Phycisphaerales bacterium]